MNRIDLWLDKLNSWDVDHRIYLGDNYVSLSDGGSIFESRTFFDSTPIARPRHSLPLCSCIMLTWAFPFLVVGVSINFHIAKATYPCLSLAASRYDP